VRTNPTINDNLNDEEISTNFSSLKNDIDELNKETDLNLLS